MYRFLVIIEKASDGGFGACTPDLPGCVAVGETLDEVEVLMHEAMQLHIADILARGETVPAPSHTAEVFAIRAPEIQTT